MDIELTTTKKKTSDFRIACFESCADSKTPLHLVKRVGDSDIQGTKSGLPKIEVRWMTTVVAPQPEGAFSSKWTRKTRPWNASLPTTVVASAKAYERTFVSVDEFGPSDVEYLENHPPYSLPDFRIRGVRGVRGEGALMRSLAQGRSPVNDAGGERREIQGRSLRSSCPEGQLHPTAPSSNVR